MDAPSIVFRKVLLRFRFLAAILFALPVIAIGARAQSSQREIKVTPGPADRAAVQSATGVYRHALPANTAMGRQMRAHDTAFEHPVHPQDFSGQDGGIIRNPGDLSYQGGPVVEFAESHPVYMLPNGNCPIATCWGDPQGFLRDLGRSEFIHLADQYVGLFASNRYTLGFHASVGYTPPSVPLTDADIQAVVHSVASASGETGYGHIYHVFLPPGQDECFDSTFTTCYSPDNPKTFAFCGYHSSVTFTDIGHVLYTVLPYANVPGCSVRPGTPNGQVADSTDNVLNHETFELISDPDGSAWFNTAAVLMFGAENGDECEFVTFVGQNAFFDPPVLNVGGHFFAVQQIYSNDAHACGTAP